MTYSRGCQLYFDFHQKNFDAKKMEITLAYIQAVIYTTYLSILSQFSIILDI